MDLEIDTVLPLCIRSGAICVGAMEPSRVFLSVGDKLSLGTFGLGAYKYELGSRFKALCKRRRMRTR